jgi:MFS family permease
MVLCRNIIFVFNAIAAVLCLASLVTDYKVFFVVRFLQGAVCGLFSAVVPTIIKEISPHDISSITGSFANASIIAGLFFLYLFGYLLKLVTGDSTGG